jgi:hypothetical protein
VVASFGNHTLRCGPQNSKIHVIRGEDISH